MAKRKNPNRLAKDTELMSLYAKKSQADALRALSKQTKVPTQVYLRRGLDWILKHPEEILK
jgi:hypothetical protein